MGSNLYGQQCFFDDGNPTDTKKEILTDDSDKIIKIASGSESSYYLFEDGEVRACGRNDQGQLGAGSFDDSYDVPVTVDLSEEVRNIFSGPSSQSVFFVLDEAVYAAGRNNRHQLGSEDSGDQKTPVEVIFDNPVNIGHLSSSGTHTVAMDCYLGIDEDRHSECSIPSDEGRNRKQ